MLTAHTIEVFQKYPSVALWRLFIDGNRQEALGPLGFERGVNSEPGYLQSMFLGFNAVLQTINEPLTSRYLQGLHAQAVKKTKHTYIVSTAEAEGEIFHQPFSAGFRYNYASFALIPRGVFNNYTRDGIRELLQTILVDDGGYFVITDRGEEDQITSKNIPKPLAEVFIDEVMGRLDSGNYSIGVSVIPTKALEARVEQLIESYNRSIIAASSPDEKIRVIARVVHELELAHPFPDGNCRTMAVLLLNKLLLQNELSPVILTNPNRFDAYSIEELSLEIRHGMDRFRAVDDEGYKDGSTLIYLKNNRSVSTLMALEILRDLEHWHEIKPAEKTRAIAVVREALVTMGLAGVSAQQLTEMTGHIRESVRQATYLKTWYQPGAFWKDEAVYGIHFESLINRVLHPASLSAQKLQAQFPSGSPH